MAARLSLPHRKDREGHRRRVRRFRQLYRGAVRDTDGLVAAGWDVVAFEGPGQGGALEEAGLPFVVEWERPVAAVLDHYGLDEVSLLGISLGGGLAVRAAAFEPRVRRVICDDILFDFLDVSLKQLPPAARAVAGQGDGAERGVAGGVRRSRSGWSTWSKSSTWSRPSPWRRAQSASRRSRSRYSRASGFNA
ncbi:MAG: alpha/beta fold hydrolase [Pseudonocardiales bacterium]|nr:alpha/beta fold hydrolase [Pseudonocardiales bacterium]